MYYEELINFHQAMIDHMIKTKPKNLLPAPGRPLKERSNAKRRATSPRKNVGPGDFDRAEAPMPKN